MELEFRELVKEELIRLGIPKINGINENKCNDSSYPRDSNFFSSINDDVGISKRKMRPSKIYKNPKIFKNSFFENQNITNTNRFQKSLSPFSRKTKFERKSWNKRSTQCSSNCIKSGYYVFGCHLECIDLHTTNLHDGSVVQIPEFIIEIHNIIKKNITIEGIFRKAGSFQRQNEIKKLLNSGKSLPPSIHPIDAACLLKHFLRSLPTPLLSYQVHFLMTRCLDLPEDEQKDALALCCLLLPKSHQEVLAYLLELFYFVTMASSENHMDSRNLAIVLAPNLLPSNGKDDNIPHNSNPRHLLSTTIDVIQGLIEGAVVMCRLTKKLLSTIETREKNGSAEDLDIFPSEYNLKKMKTTPINRFLNVLRRLVQGGSQASQSVPSPCVVSDASKTPRLLQDSTLSINMDPEGCSKSASETPGKRKLDMFGSNEGKDAFSLPVKGEYYQLHKKGRFELKGPTRSSRSNSSTNSTKKFWNVKSEDKFVAMPKRRHSLGSKKEYFCQGSSGVSSNLGRRGSSVFIRPKRTHGIQDAASSRCNSNASKSPSHLSGKRPGNVHNGIKTGSCKEKGKLTQMLRPILPSSSPHSCTLSPANSGEELFGENMQKIPNAKYIQNSLSDDNIPGQIFDLEQKYCAIKSVVQTVEKQVDEGNLKDLKDKYFSFPNVTDFSNLSCSQLIHNAYEKMKLEMGGLECSPSENLSRRLGKELKIRSRRSDEYRVIRSPSERRIESIRRKSRELEHNVARGSHEDPTEEHEPKPKQNILYASHAALKRGRPNSVKSGLPFLIKAPLLSLEGDNTPKSNRLSSHSFVLNNSLIYTPKLSPASISRTRRGNIRLTRRISVISADAIPVPSSESPSGFLNNKKDAKYSLSKNIQTVNSSLQMSSSEENCSDFANVDWVPASRFMKDRDSLPEIINKQLNPNLSTNRPSIIVLKEQKKVTSNIQLFNQTFEQSEYLHNSDRSFSKFQSPLFSPSMQGLRARGTRRSHTPLRVLDNEDCGKRRGWLPQKSPNSNSYLLQKSETPKIINIDAKSGTRYTKPLQLPQSVTPLPPRSAKGYPFLSKKDTTKPSDI